ncbi:MAG TPA: hypothetical protein VMN81_13755 [Vicinamibacterales bacterium]|nr:hypothetical protein [Vicinamibacterales bacterium]
MCGAHELLSQAPTAPAQFTVAPLTSHGLVGRSDLAPAVSPDGRHVAYIRFDRPGPDVRSEIWILDRQTMREEVLIPQAHVEYWGIDFAPDGRAVYAARSLPPFNEAALIRARLTDRRVETVRANVGREPAISPDGRSVAFNRRVEDPPGRELIVAPLDGGDERVVARRKRPEALNYPIWRADGGAIHFRTLDAGHATILVEVTLADGAERVITKPEGWANASPAAWLPDGNAFVLTANQGSELWRVSYPDGALQRLGFTRPAILSGLDGAAAEPVIVGVRTTSAHRLWTARPDGADAGVVRPWPYPFSQPIWTADDKLLFVRRGATGPELVVTEPGGQEIRVHALGVPAARFPKRSRDGQVIVWSSDAVGDRRFWRTGPGGENPAKLTTGPSDFFGSDVSPDGTWIVYTTWATGRFAVWKMELSGGPPSRLIAEESMLPAISPDGQWVAAYYRPSPGGPERIVIVPAAGGEPVSLGELPTADGGLKWTPDGGAVSFSCAPNGIPNICVVPRGGGRAKQITAFTEGEVASYDWSATGQLLVVRSVTKADLVRIELR